MLAEACRYHKVGMPWVGLRNLKLFHNAARSCGHHHDPIRQIHSLVYGVCDENHSEFFLLPEF
jgi:hypothetical protein